MNLRIATSLPALLILILIAPSALADDGADDGATDDEAGVEAPGEEAFEPPELLYAPEAEYTEEAFDARIEGAVILEIEIDAAGDVSNVEVVEGLGFGLDEAAVAAAEAFAFQPARLDGEPIPVILPFRVDFSLPILPAEFTGQLVDPVSDEPIAGARVSIRYEGDQHDPAPEASTLTDEAGRFSFSNVPPGPYGVNLSIEEYRDFDTDIDLVGGETVDVDYSVPRADDNIVGQVLEAGTRAPLAGMELTLIDPDSGEDLRETFSEAGGAFSFRDLPPGGYILRVRGSSHVTTIFDVDVADEEVTTGTFFVRADEYDAFRVETRADRERAEVTRQTLGLDEVRRVPGAGTDVLRVVQNLPGVARPSFVGGQLIVRGAAPEDSQIFLGGDNIPIAYHFLGGPAVINTEMVESIDFYPGNFSARFGRATAAIIDLQTRSPKTDRLHGFVEVDLLDSSAIIEGPITDNWSFALAGRRSYYDLFLPAVLSAVGTDVVASPRYYDYQGWATYRSDSGNHKVELFVYGSDDRLEVIFPDGEPVGDASLQLTDAAFDNRFYRGQVRWEWTPEHLPLDTALMSSFGLNTTALEATEDLFFVLDFYQNQTRYDARLELADNLTLRGGLDAQIGNVLYEFAIPSTNDGSTDAAPIPDSLVDERQTPFVQPALYTEVDYELFDRWQLTPGLRVDYFGATGEVSVSPRLSTSFDLTDEVILKGGVGLFTQPPIPGQTEEDFGNPDLSSEKAIHYALGGEWRPLDYVELDTTLFFRDSYDLVASTAAERIDDEGNRVPLLFDNRGLGRAYGWELLLRHYPRNNFFGWVSYTLSRSERYSPTRDQWEPFSFDQTHILTMLAGYNLPLNIDISARFRLVTGNPETPVVGAAFDADDDTYRRQTGDRNSVRATPFHQLDLRMDRQFIFDTWRLSTYLDITNIYNSTNPEGTQYNFDFSESAPLRGLPILPTIGVSARF